MGVAMIDFNAGEGGVTADCGKSHPDTEEKKCESDFAGISYCVAFSPDLACNFTELARMIRGNWDDFVGMLEKKTDEKLIRFIEAFGSSAGTRNVADNLMRVIESKDPSESKLIQMQILLDPTVSPVFKGSPLDKESIMRIANAALDGDDASALWMQSFLEARVFAAMAEISGAKEYAEASFYIDKWRNQVALALAEIPEGHEEIVCRIRQRENSTLVLCALSLDEREQAGLITYMNAKKEGLCCRSYTREADWVNGIVETLSSIDRLDVGYLFVWNEILESIYKEELMTYIEAIAAIERKDYRFAISELEEILLFDDASDLIIAARESQRCDELAYEKAWESVRRFDFAAACELFGSLGGYADSAVLADATKKASDSHLDVVILPRKIAGLEGIKAERTAELGKLEKEAFVASQRIAYANEEIQSSEQELKALCSEVAAEEFASLKAVEEQIEAIEVTCKYLTVQAEVQSRRREEIRSLISTCRHELEICKKEKQSVQSLILETESAIFECEKEVSFSAKQCGEALDRLVEAKESFAAYDGRMTDLANTKFRKYIRPRTFRKEIQEQEDLVKDAESKVSECLRLYSELCSTAEERKALLDELEAKKSRLTTRSSVLNSAIVGKGAVFRKKSSELGQIDDSREKTKAKLSEALADVDQLKEIRDRLEEQILSRRNELREGQRDRFAPLFESRELLVGELNAIQAKIDEVTSSIVALEGELLALLDKFEKAKSKIDPLQFLAYCKVASSVSEAGFDRFSSLMHNIAKSKQVAFGVWRSGELNWDVLCSGSDGALLVCRESWEMCFDEAGNAETWEESSLFKWLNTEFFSSAFDEFEQELVVSGGKQHNARVFIASSEHCGKLTYSELYRGGRYWASDILLEESSKFVEYKKDYAKNHFDEQQLAEVANAVAGILGHSSGPMRMRAEIPLDVCREMMFDEKSLRKIVETEKARQAFEKARQTVEKARQTVEKVRQSVKEGRLSVDFRRLSFEKSIDQFREGANPGVIEEYWYQLQDLYEDARDVFHTRFEESCYCKIKKGAQIENGKLCSTGRPLSEVASVRPMVWIPYEALSE